MHYYAAKPCFVTFVLVAFPSVLRKARILEWLGDESSFVRFYYLLFMYYVSLYLMSYQNNMLPRWYSIMFWKVLLNNLCPGVVSQLGVCVHSPVATLGQQRKVASVRDGPLVFLNLHCLLTFIIIIISLCQSAWHYFMHLTAHKYSILFGLNVSIAYWSCTNICNSAPPQIRLKFSKPFPGNDRKDTYLHIFTYATVISPITLENKRKKDTHLVLHTE